MARGSVGVTGLVYGCRNSRDTGIFPIAVLFVCNGSTKNMRRDSNQLTGIGKSARRTASLEFRCPMRCLFIIARMRLLVGCTRETLEPAGAEGAPALSESQVRQ